MDSLELALFVLLSSPFLLFGLVLMFLIIISILGQIEGRNGLVIHQSGFRLIGYRYFGELKWSQCSAFEAGHIHLRYTRIHGAVFYFGHKKRSFKFIRDALDKRVVPSYHYGMSPKELSEILNKYRDNFLKQNVSII